MKSIASVQSAISNQEVGRGESFPAQFNQYLQKQRPVVRGLHHALTGLAIFCLVLAVILHIIGLYYTFLWATTGSFTSLGQATYLPTAWVNFGLSMSFLVFPWGLDSMLLRVFPAIVFPATWYKPKKPISYKTGVGAFFAGFGIMCAGAPGAVYITGLALRALQQLF